LSTITQDSLSITPKKRGRKPKHRKVHSRPLPLTSVERRVSEEIPPVIVKEPVVILTPTEIPLNNNRKRKTSDIKEGKKRRFISSPSPELIYDYQDISYSDR
jgi:hypothetical protein